MTDVPVNHDFESYVPPRWFQPTVERLLSSVSAAHVHGLSAIVLTNSRRAQARKGRRSARRQRRGTPLGRYHWAYRGERAWIELMVDAIVEDMPAPLRHLQCARDMAVGCVLYHELGHHLHATVGSAARGGERSAEAWLKRLSRLHVRKRYGYLRPVLGVIRRVATSLRWLVARRRKLK